MGLKAQSAVPGVAISIPEPKVQKSFLPMSGATFYQDKGQIQKLCLKAALDADHNLKGCYDSITQAFKIASKYVETQKQPTEFGQVSSFVKKPLIKKYCKDAVSEIDFDNLQGAIEFMVKAFDLFN